MNDAPLLCFFDYLQSLNTQPHNSISVAMALQMYLVQALHREHIDITRFCQLYGLDNYPDGVQAVKSWMNRRLPAVIMADRGENTIIEPTKARIEATARQYVAAVRRRCAPVYTPSDIISIQFARGKVRRIFADPDEHESTIGRKLERVLNFVNYEQFAEHTASLIDEHPNQLFLFFVKYGYDLSRVINDAPTPANIIIFPVATDAKNATLQAITAEAELLGRADPSIKSHFRFHTSGDVTQEHPADELSGYELSTVRENMMTELAIHSLILDIKQLADVQEPVNGRQSVGLNIISRELPLDKRIRTHYSSHRQLIDQVHCQRKYGYECDGMTVLFFDHNDHIIIAQQDE